MFVFFLMVLGGLFSGSAGWTLVTLEHSEKFKMASISRISLSLSS